MKILVPIDGSPDALDALRHALALLHDGLRGALLLVNVQEPATLWELLRAHDAAAIEKISRSAGEHALQEAVRLASARGAAFETVVAHGEPAHLLIDLAEERGCSLIVAGVHGQGGTTGSRLGSVAHALLHDAALPVTLVRRAAEA